MNKAFTLIELLVVVLIIGILSAIALPQYQTAVLKSRLITVVPNVKAMIDALEVYYLANGQYPNNDVRDLGIEIGGCTEYRTDRLVCSNAVYDYQENDAAHQIGGFLTGYQGVAYVQWPTKDTSAKAGQRECWADSGNAAANTVCKSLGGTSNGTQYWRSGSDYEHSKNEWNVYTLH